MTTSFVTRLEELGYFKGLPAEREQELKRDFERQGWLAIFNDSHRFFQADAEDLAEGGIGRLFREVASFLVHQGVRLPLIEEEFSGHSYAVRLDGVTHTIYDAAELERDISGEEAGLTWGLSMARGFRLYDRVLAAAKSAERAYAINGGNDLFLLFLTPELHQMIMAHPEASRVNGPYRPTEAYPQFGQPEED
jgi:hypothetical protein